MKVLGIVGSPRKQRGRTDVLVQRALEGARSVGAETEVMYLRDRDLQPCIHCGGRCFETASCEVEQDATLRSQEVAEADGLIVGAPVYIWQLNGLTAAFIDKLRLRDVRPPCATTNPRVALGITVAGGTGTGLISALKSLYAFFCLWGFRAIDPLPVTRHNFSQAEEISYESGVKLARLCNEQKTFDTKGDCLAHYAGLPFMDFDMTDEFLYLSQLIAENTQVTEGNRECHEQAKHHIETAMLLVDQRRKQEASVHAGRAYELAREAYGD